MRTKADVGLGDRRLYKSQREPVMTGADSNPFADADVIVCYQRNADAGLTN